jgi:bacterioferritin-associated ferredoxin
MYICICHAVTEKEIRAAVELGLDSPEAIGECLGAGTRCGQCRPAVEACVDTARPRAAELSQTAEAA